MAARTGSHARLAWLRGQNGLADGEDEGARAALGDKFPKLLFHKVACIGALGRSLVAGRERVSPFEAMARDRQHGGSACFAKYPAGTLKGVDAHLDVEPGRRWEPLGTPNLLWFQL
jgi:hypothetical protein